MTRPAAPGFALAEALVGIALVAIMLAVTSRVVIDNARTDRALRDRRGAVLVAQSVLDQATAAPDAAAQVASGRAGGYSWRVSRRGFGVPGAGTLDRVGVEVLDGRGRIVVSLATLRAPR